MSEELGEEPVGRWCLVANVVEECEYGQEHELRPGTKHFSPGTKVYCDSAHWGDGWEKIYVLGRHRGSKEWVRIVTPFKCLHNFRAKCEYGPHVRRLLDEVYKFHLGGYSAEDKQDVEAFARSGNDAVAKKEVELLAKRYADATATKPGEDEDAR